jgi:hypothetical protein
MYGRARSVPESGADQYCELKKEEEQGDLCGAQVDTPGRKGQSRDIPTQVEAAPSLGNHGERAQRNEGHRENCAENSRATMNLRPSRGHQTGLEQKQEEPRDGHRGVRCHQGGQRQWNAAPGGIDE